MATKALVCLKMPWANAYSAQCSRLSGNFQVAIISKTVYGKNPFLAQNQTLRFYRVGHIFRLQSRHHQLLYGIHSLSCPWL